VAEFLSLAKHRAAGDYVAGAVLVSGDYSENQAEDRSIANGFADTGLPIVLAWSTTDAPKIVAEGVRLNRSLCDSGHCPRSAVWKGAGNPTSVFNLDGASMELHERFRQMIGQIDALTTSTQVTISLSWFEPM
jgi:hypothetical protein